MAPLTRTCWAVVLFFAASLDRASAIIRLHGTDIANLYNGQAEVRFLEGAPVVLQNYGDIVPTQGTLVLNSLTVTLPSGEKRFLEFSHSNRFFVEPGDTSICYIIPVTRWNPIIVAMACATPPLGPENVDGFGLFCKPDILEECGGVLPHHDILLGFVNETFPAIPMTV
ncbi:hypothetical protein COCOBI_18-3220 [Coccomyxa sp. Obi]|nr:hypothetical protein COCOBI_18-3220 [Coccomyxa sp. Obi]